MAKIERIQRSKIMSSYGGIGSIIETRSNGSLLVKPYDNWGCFCTPQNGRRTAWQNRNEINCARLLDVISQITPYQGVRSLREIPVVGSDNYKPAQTMTIQTERFPHWFYCPKCRRLKKLDSWRAEWANHGQGWTADNFNNAFPSCAQHSERIDPNRFRRKHLIQIRFVMASLDGLLADVPFDRLFDAEVNGDAYIINQDTPSRDDLTYNTSAGGDGLYDVTIKSDNDRLSLSAVYGRYIVVQDVVDGIQPGAYRMMLKGATNLYYPKVLSCLQLPEQNGGNNTQGGNNGQVDGDQQLRMSEYDYITNPDNYPYGRIDNADFSAERYNAEIVAITCLKEVSVLTAYTRIMPAGQTTRWYDTRTHNVEENMQPSLRSPFSRGIMYMPAVEAYGEGLFFKMDFAGNMNYVQEQDRFTYMHTYCHALMKELEFVCGYPVTSLRERLYEDPATNRYGFLIYTIAGDAGSYGGLTSLGLEKLQHIISSALARALHCPNDPICQNDNGHCFACVDLPETSCEKFNNDLDRRILNRYCDLNGTAFSNDERM